MSNFRTKFRISLYFSVFIKSEHVLYCLFFLVLFPFEGIREKRENKSQEKSSILQCTMKWIISTK